MDWKVAVKARQPHYRHHIAPIWDALPEEVKWSGAWQQHDNPMLIVAGASDVVNGRPYIYVEHGAGQSYVGINRAGYSGGEHHQGARLFICPNIDVAERWMSRYPDTPTAIVGCPKLDQYHVGPPPPEKTIAITFHWDCKVVPESRSAWPHYQAGIYTMVSSWREQGWRVLGHAHPRFKDLKPRWRAMGVEWTDDPLRDACALAADNTSMIPEFLSCGRPVLALNAPWYRRDVHHGLRFWDLDVTYADTALEASLTSLDSLKAPSTHPYAYADGKASQRAAQAITNVLQGR